MALNKVSPDLFGHALLVRQWGRIGTEGRRRLEPHPDPGAAFNALSRLAARKRGRGYRDRAFGSMLLVATRYSSQARG
jgi:predicted DNA-binding WGR domain protein